MGKTDPYLGVFVGILQFEVLKERIKNEYNVKMELEPLSFTVARWIGGGKDALEWLEQSAIIPFWLIVTINPFYY